jgi:hypothetical protein
VLLVSFFEVLGKQLGVDHERIAWRVLARIQVLHQVVLVAHLEGGESEAEGDGQRRPSGTATNKMVMAVIK